MPKHQSNTLLVTVLDVSPYVWGQRDMQRKARDRARQAENKGSIGPTTIDELVPAVEAFGNSILNLERSASLIVVAVAGNETAVVYPRAQQLTEWLGSGAPVDSSYFAHMLVLGVNELITRASRKVPPSESRLAAMASGFSTALCLINRLLVAAQAGGVSALPPQHYMERVEDQGVVAMMDSGGGVPKQSKLTAWSPRILLVQASDDRARDYNAMMNCTFAAIKNDVTVDACYLATSPKDSSHFLEQVCDLTGGVFSAPSGMAQLGGALTEVFLAIFLAPRQIRPSLNLPSLSKVDFRARCFETGEMVSIATVCNLCLSIFARKPQGVTHCPTCQAKIVDE